MKKETEDYKSCERTSRNKLIQQAIKMPDREGQKEEIESVRDRDGQMVSGSGRFNGLSMLLGVESKSEPILLQKIQSARLHFDCK